MGQWMHSWGINEINLSDPDHGAKTIEDWSNNFPVEQYADKTLVDANCIYDNYEMEIVHFPKNRRFSDIGVNAVHECQWEDYLTENDPGRVWVDDEGNVMSAEAAPASAKKELRKK